MFYAIAGLFLGTALMVLLDWVRKGNGFVIASRTNYILWVLIDVALSILVGLYYLLSHHPVMWLVLLPLIAICVPLVVSKYRQLGFWRAN